HYLRYPVYSSGPAQHPMRRSFPTRRSSDLHRWWRPCRRCSLTVLTVARRTSNKTASQTTGGHGSSTLAKEISTTTLPKSPTPTSTKLSNKENTSCVTTHATWKQQSNLTPPGKPPPS